MQYRRAYESDFCKDDHKKNELGGERRCGATGTANRLRFKLGDQLGHREPGFTGERHQRLEGWLGVTLDVLADEPSGDAAALSKGFLICRGLFQPSCESFHRQSIGYL